MEWINALGEALLTSVQSTATKQLRNSSQPIAELLFLAVLASSPAQKGGATVSSGPKLTELTWLFLELSEVSELLGPFCVCTFFSFVHVSSLYPHVSYEFCIVICVYVTIIPASEQIQRSIYEKEQVHHATPTALRQHR